MRKSLCLVLAIGCGLTALRAQPVQWAKISQVLQQRLLAEPTQVQNVYLLLRDKVDVLAWESAPAKVPFLPQQSVPALIRHLQQTARQTQAPLRSLLAQEPGVEASSIRSFWISNALFFRASPQALYRLSQREEIAWIDWNAPLVSDGPVAPGAYRKPKSVGGHEPGHTAIGAPALWARGYSGYGQTLLVLDSGVDPSHPALSGQYQGNRLPDAISWYEPGGSSSPVACDFHGTFVTGIALGLDPLQADTIGVAPGAEWMAAPVVPGNGGICTGVSAVAAFQWALDPDGSPNTTDDIPDVINNSWSLNLPAPGQDCNSIYKDILDVLEVAGIAVVWSAGNLGPGSNSIASPKNINTNEVNAFCVGAVNANFPHLPIYNSSSRGPSLCASLQLNTFKPEVVAPGRSVRSSALNGTYAVQSGTSMSTPYVSGALLLLKEAFPQLNGKQLLRALYHSCLDLGSVGEDNDYGRGLIQVQAAFDTLVAQGYTPASVSDSNDVSLVALKLSDQPYCATPIIPEIVIENRGTRALFQLSIQYQYEEQGPDTLEWMGTLASGSRDTLTLPAFLPNTSGAYAVQVELVLANGAADYHHLDNGARKMVGFLSAAPLMLTADTVCQGNRAWLQADLDSGLALWYKQPVGGMPQFTGNQVLSDTLWADQTWYVAQQGLAQAGKVDNQGDMGTYTAGEAYLYLNVERAFRLEQVQVYSARDGFRTFVLLDPYGALLAEKTVFINLGPRKVQLDFEVPVGKGYRLGLRGQDIQLFTSTSGVNFPYEHPGIVSLTHSSLDDSLSQVYPYCYAWQISYEGCREELHVPVQMTPLHVSFSMNPDTLDLGLDSLVTFSDQTAMSQAWRWDFGDGSQGILPWEQHGYTSPGSYPILLQSQGPTGCWGTAWDTLWVRDVNTALDAQKAFVGLQVGPNPGQGPLTISWKRPLSEPVRLRAFTARGQLWKDWGLKSGPTISLNWPPQTGVFYLEVRSQSARQFLKILRY